MTQIAVKLEGVDFYDLSLNEDDGERLLLDESLRTAVLISLLTDRRVEPSQAPEPSNLGGYWGDTYAESPSEVVGSRLWTLAGRGMTPALLGEAEGFIREALSWMVDLGVVESPDAIEIELAFVATHALGGKIGITRPNSPNPEWITEWIYSLERG